MYAQYYTSLVSVFENALTYMKEFPDEEVQEYIERMQGIATQASGMGWGYSDSITYMLRTAYPEK